MNLQKNKHHKILILDFGSQVTQLIARRLRELGFYSEIKGYQTSLDQIKEFNPKAIILSGGPFSVYEKEAPLKNVSELIELYPVLGICYGMQLLAHQLGGEVKSSNHREYGLKEVFWKTDLEVIKNNFLSQLMTNSKKPSSKVWMSHGDVVLKIPQNAKLLCETQNHIAGFYTDKYWALQYHPEVSHSEMGSEILKSFLDEFNIKPDWNAKSLYESAVDVITTTVQTQSDLEPHVLCALSGGVDSSVVATLLTKVLGANRVHCVFINNGLLRENEFETVLKFYKDIGLNVLGLDREDQFLSALSGVSDPEQKRKIIGNLFISVFDAAIENELKDYKNKIKFLAQGTLYPDVIESVSSVGGSVTIKSHHNVGGLPEKMNLKLVEPLRFLFKDEVRKLGLELGLPSEMVMRHPFPGPGLSIRVLGEVTQEKLQILKKADSIFIKLLHENQLYEKIWQAFCVLLPVQTVGVMGDGRTYEYVLSLRAVTSKDGMTADWYEFDHQFLKKASTEIINQVKGLNRVVYDITSKPPATIEWE